MADAALPVLMYHGLHAEAVLDGRGRYDPVYSVASRTLRAPARLAGRQRLPHACAAATSTRATRRRTSCRVLITFDDGDRVERRRWRCRCWPSAAWSPNSSSPPISSARRGMLRAADLRTLADGRHGRAVARREPPFPRRSRPRRTGPPNWPTASTRLEALGGAARDGAGPARRPRRRTRAVAALRAWATVTCSVRCPGRNRGARSGHWLQRFAVTRALDLADFAALVEWHGVAAAGRGGALSAARVVQAAARQPAATSACARHARPMNAIALFWSSVVLVGLHLRRLSRCWSRCCARRRGSGVQTAAHTPALTVVIAAYDEARADRRASARRACPGLSSDRLRRARGRRRQSRRHRRAGDRDRRARARAQRCRDNVGKAAALNAAMAVVDTEFVVFTDARQRFAAGALRRLLAPFADPRVGAVSGELVIGEATARAGTDRTVLAHGKVPARRRGPARLAARRQRRDLRAAPRALRADAARPDSGRPVDAAAGLLRRRSRVDGARCDRLRQPERHAGRGIPPQAAHAGRQLAIDRPPAALGRTRSPIRCSARGSRTSSCVCWLRGHCSARCWPRRGRTARCTASRWWRRSSPGSRRRSRCRGRGWPGASPCCRRPAPSSCLNAAALLALPALMLGPRRLWRKH